LDQFCLFELSERGALFISEFSPKDEGMDIDHASPVVVEYSDEVKKLRVRSSSSEYNEDLRERRSDLAKHAAGIYRGALQRMHFVRNS
jgi:hypothetical protein